MNAADATVPEDDRAQTRALVRDSAVNVMAREGGLARARRWRRQSPGFDRALWRRLCELGWPGLHLPDAEGGSGLGLRELCAVAEAMGRVLAPEPLVGSAACLRLLDGGDRRSVLDGSRVVLPAWQEQANRPGACATRFEGGRLHGSKCFVAMAEGADVFVVTTTTGPVLVERGAAGLSLQVQDTQDGGAFGSLQLDGAPGRALPGDAALAQDEAALLTAAYLLGVMECAFGMTLDHLRTREQFGRPIGGFQALQHRAVDLKIQLALTRASVDSAAATLDAGADRDTRERAVSRAKARASDAALLITRQAIQLHGAIGYTDEHDVGLCLRKAMVLAPLHGSGAVHRARFARLHPL